MGRIIGLLMMVGLAVNVGCGSDGEQQNPLKSSNISIDKIFDAMDDDQWSIEGYQGAELTSNGFINNGDIKTGTINNTQTSCYARTEKSYCHTVLWEFNLSYETAVDITVHGANDITFYVFRYENGDVKVVYDAPDDATSYSRRWVENDEDEDSLLPNYKERSVFSQVLKTGTYFIAIGSFKSEDNYLLETAWDPTSELSEDPLVGNWSGNILGTWKKYGSSVWIFNADGTGTIPWEDDGSTNELMDINFNWSLVGSTLTISDTEDGTMFGDYPIEIIAMSSTQLVYIEKWDKDDGSGTIEQEVTRTR